MDKIFIGDSLTILRSLQSNSVQTCVTSPPYFGLRDYGMKGQLGLEDTPAAYVQKLVELFREVRRVLRDDGTLWLNLGDSYAAGGNGGHGAKQHSNRGTRALAGKAKKAPNGLKPKDLVGIPWRVGFALQADGWYLRQDIIWAKPNPMPESVTDRCTKAHEYIFLLSKSPKYYYDAAAIKTKWKPNASDIRRSLEGSPKYNGKHKNGYNGNTTDGGVIGNALKGANKRSVWTVSTRPYRGAHFATFPPDLITPCILAGAPNDGVVLDPFFGSGTTGAVAKSLGRQYIGIELNPAYVTLARERLAAVQHPLAA
jgi:DNA modification methylase